MKILIIAENVFFPRDANGNCVWNIAKELQCCKNVVHILSTATCREEMEQDSIEGVFCHWHYTPWRYPIRKIKQEIIAHPAASFFHLAAKLYNKCYLSKREKDTIIKKREIFAWKTSIKKALCSQKFDKVIICFYPIEPTAAYCTLKDDGADVPPFWIYQVDAYVDNVGYAGTDRNVRVRFVQQAFGKAEGVFTTPLLENTLREILHWKDDRITALEFPLLVEHPLINTSVTLRDSNMVCGVFAGALYKNIRWPEFMLKLFNACAINNLKLCLFVSNPLDKNEVNEWKILTQNVQVEFCQSVSFNEMIAIMRQADFLINIGNKSSNQLPSKVIDYIALGKPILNIIQVKNCPSIHYLEKYPMVLNVRTWDDFDKSVERCKAFIQNVNTVDTMPFCQTQKIFEELTPQSVTKKILKCLQGP